MTALVVLWFEKIGFWTLWTSDTIVWRFINSPAVN